MHTPAKQNNFASGIPCLTSIIYEETSFCSIPSLPLLTNESTSETSTAYFKATAMPWKIHTEGFLHATKKAHTHTKVHPKFALSHRLLSPVIRATVEEYFRLVLVKNCCSKWKPRGDGRYALPARVKRAARGNEQHKLVKITLIT